MLTGKSTYIVSKNTKLSPTSSSTDTSVVCPRNTKFPLLIILSIPL
jgi:hypothetical protein